MDAQARTVDNAAPLPLTDRVHRECVDTEWVQNARVRVLDMGHVFSVDVRVQPRPGHAFTAEDLEALQQRVEQLEETIYDMTITPVTDLPAQ